MLRDAISGLELVGYPVVLIMGVVGSGGFVFPIPALASVCGLSPLLSPAIVGLVNGFGEAAGEMTGYAVGYGSHRAIERRRIYQWAKGWMERRGTLALFLVSIVPNPFFDIVGIVEGRHAVPNS